MRNLGFIDLAIVTVCWLGAGTTAYITKDGVVAVIALAAAYYLSKWTILRKE